MTSPDTAVGTRMPRALVVALVAWVLDAGVLVLAWLNSGPAGPDASDESLGAIRGSLGDTAVDPGPSGWPVPVLAAVLAALILLLTLALGARKGRARYPLVLAGAAAVVLLAPAGRWETVPAMVLLMLGTVPLLLPAVHRRLA
jgi:hypothetical protein